MALALRSECSFPLVDIVRWMGIQTNGDVAEKLLNVPIPSRTDPLEPTVKEHSRYDDLFECWPYLGLNLYNYTVFTTTDGHIGWSLRKLREDDIVCTLLGLRAPVILRKVDESFRYITPCSIVGLMDEDRLKPDFDPTEIQTFDFYSTLSPCSDSRRVISIKPEASFCLEA